MNFLFVHQNFPGQYLHLVRSLRDSGHTVVFVTQRRAREIPGILLALRIAALQPRARPPRVPAYPARNPGRGPGSATAAARLGRLEGPLVHHQRQPPATREGRRVKVATLLPAANARLTIWASQQQMGGSMYSLAGTADAEGHYPVPMPGKTKVV